MVVPEVVETVEIELKMAKMLLQILEAAEAEGADVVGLSALMTSTVPQMETVIRRARERGAPYRIVVGGAAVSPAYAESIGADGTSSDAVGAARLVERLLAHQAGESPRTNP